MSLLKALGIDKYTTRFKQWIASKYVAKDNLKTINGESLEGEGNIEISGGGSSVNADWNQKDNTQPDYIKNRTHYYAQKLQYKGEIEVFIDNKATYALSPYEYIDQDIYGYRVPDKIKFTGGGTSFTLDFIKEPIPGYNYEEDIQEAVTKRFTIDEDTDIEVTYYNNGNPDYIEGTIIELELIATDSNYQEYVAFVTEDYYVDLKQIDEKYIPDTIARKSDLNTNTNTTKNITTEFGITIEDLLGDYNDYYSFWIYVTEGYNAINYNNDENTIAFPISKREDSEITGERMYIPYPDGQIEIYYSDGSGLGGKIIKTFVDPIVYKYLCNPYEVYVGGGGAASDPIPEDLFNIINDNPNIAQKVIVINYEDSAYQYIGYISSRNLSDNIFYVLIEYSTYRMYINENRTITLESS